MFFERLDESVEYHPIFGRPSVVWAGSNWPDFLLWIHFAARASRCPSASLYCAALHLPPHHSHFARPSHCCASDAGFMRCQVFTKLEKEGFSELAQQTWRHHWDYQIYKARPVGERVLRARLGIDPL